MNLFSRKQKSADSPERIAEELERSRERAEFLLHAVRALLYIAREFSLDLPDIDTEGYRKRIDELTKRLTGEEPSAALAKAFEGDKAAFLEFAGQEKKFLIDREKELKNIIELLRKGMSEILGDNQDFSSKVYEQNLRIEQVAGLEDMRKIKETLKTEVSQMKQVVQMKQERDQARMTKLTEEITVLKSDLARVKDSASTDPLTGALNRLAFDSIVKSLVERYHVTSIPFSMLMCDLDHFKKINDSYGHQVGDRVLMAFVAECKNLFRKDDVIARYGGEEFVVILPRASLRNAVKRAKVLCKAVAARQYLVDPERPNEKLSFTASVGVSALRGSDTVETIIKRADKALYEAKRTGRNRVVSEKDIKA